MALTSGYRNGGLRRLGAGTAFAAVLVGSGGALAAAQPTPEEQQQTWEGARQVLTGATVESIEIDLTDGAPKWEVDARTRDGAQYEVMVDMNSATVLSIEPDDD
ncbi:PepSY domain-containing protein [Nocardia paucivorans]|uniref:PepSY domain-containing protein n=1 Tax=Nocardia paucivorans TaxID=114259 RepID=UPI0002F2E1C9|nr:PepSY domain-containing protein [Nocardia paucivorans]